MGPKSYDKCPLKSEAREPYRKGGGGPWRQRWERCSHRNWERQLTSYPLELLREQNLQISYPRLQSRENTSLVFEPSSLWSFVTAALGNHHNAHFTDRKLRCKSRQALVILGAGGGLGIEPRPSRDREGIRQGHPRGGVATRPTSQGSRSQAGPSL